jgi:hypothetical protein
MRARGAAAVTALAVLLGPVATAHGAARELDLRLTVGADAVVSVQDSLRWEPRTVDPLAERTIPLRTSDRRLLRVRDVIAADGHGTALRADVTEGEDALVVRTRDALAMGAEGEVRLVLRYRAFRAVRQADAGQWMEWAIAPWSGDVLRLRVSVDLPPTLARTDAVGVQLGRGTGERWPAEVQRTARGIALRATLPPQPAPVHILVTWPGTHVDVTAPEPAVPWPSHLAFDAVWIVPGLLAGLGALVVAGRRLASGGVVPTYGPPPSVRPGEAGVLIDGRVDSADVVATAVDLALRGYLRLEPSAGDLMVSVARPWLHDPDLRSFEVVLLAHVFTDGVHSARLSELRGQGESPTAIKDEVSAELTARGYFQAAPRAVRRLGLGVAGIVLGVWTQLTMNARGIVTGALTGVLTGLALWWLLHVLSVGRLTAKGRRARQELRGYEEYLRRVEKDRLDRLTPGTLDEHLPWAIALGVSGAWLEATPTP